jgi:hypothetical protein
MLENSDAGQLITQAEYTNIIQSSWPGNATQTMVDAFIRRVNNSLGGDAAATSDNSTIDYIAVLTTGNAIAGYSQSAADVCLAFMLFSQRCFVNQFDHELGFT